MDFKGRIVRCQAAEEIITVQRAEVTDERIALDWTQDGRTAFLIAKSANGSHFQGRFGYQQEKLEYACELTLFKARQEDLLYGTWHEHDTNRTGTLAIRLSARNFDVRTDVPSAESSSPDVEPNSAVEHGAIDPEPAVTQPSKVFSASAAPSSRAPERVPAFVVRAALPASAPAIVQLSSAQVDHLLSISDEQFNERGGLQIEEELMAAPVPALFKLAHNAVAVELRALAARLFADRYSPAPVSGTPARAPRAKESPELRAQKRRSSKHGRKQ